MLGKSWYLFWRDKSKLPQFFEIDGCRGYLFQGVFFTEGIPGSAKSIAQVETSSNVQNTNLDWLREKLASQVKARGGNALIGFRYVQKASIWSFSSVSWNADGTAALIENLDNLAQELTTDDKGGLRDCPMCAETIKKAAVKCRFCGASV